VIALAAGRSKLGSRLAPARKLADRPVRHLPREVEDVQKSNIHFWKMLKKIVDEINIS
jgi:hypothetical protein